MNDNLSKKRIHSIDIVRGLIMIIMTLDHVRDFLHYPGPSPVNMQTTTVVLFFTRWITHFCAPTFVFLAGVSACLAGQSRTKKELSAMLLKRGAWLILSDLLIISLLFSFDLGYHILVLEVLWATGFGMILLALLLRAPLAVIAGIGLAIILGHNLLDGVQVPQQTAGGTLLTIFLTAIGSVFPLSGNRMVVELYAVLPWSAMLFLGYGFGALYRKGYDATRRRKVLLLSGLAFVVLFIVLRALNIYGDPRPWTFQRNAAHTLLSFLNATKQPPSLLYVAMTLGPVLMLLSFTEHAEGWFSRICRVYGGVPYFYFIVHLCLIRVLHMVLILGKGLPFQRTDDPLVWQAVGFGIPLWAVYIFWILVVAMLYWPCRWYGQYKRGNASWWLAYV